MFKDKKVDYTVRRKVAAEMKLDGYMSMVEISGRGMYFETKFGLYKINAIPSDIRKHVEESDTINGYKLYFGGKTYKYWYKVEDLVNLPWTKKERTY